MFVGRGPWYCRGPDRGFEDFHFCCHSRDVWILKIDLLDSMNKEVLVFCTWFLNKIFKTLKYHCEVQVQHSTSNCDPEVGS